MEQIATVVEDQPVIWDYARLCLKDRARIVEFCATTEEAEEAFFKYRPDLVWLDCYLGEVSDATSGPKNSGISLAAWMKRHRPQTKIFLFTASNDPTILKAARVIGIDGIAMGGKFVRDRQVIVSGIETVLTGNKWVSPSLVEDIELDEFSRVTVFEFAVLCSMMLGKNTAQIAEELDTTRKRVNNAIYRVKEKLGINDAASKDYVMDVVREQVIERLSFNDSYIVSDIMAINSAITELLGPILTKLRSGTLERVYLGLGAAAA